MLNQYYEYRKMKLLYKEKTNHCYKLQNKIIKKIIIH